MSKHYTIKVPATSANLGPGFDCLGMALDIYNELLIEPLEGTDVLEIDIEGFGANAGFDSKENLIYRAYKYAFESIAMPCPGIKMTAINKIPFARGLGSSSAAIVAGLLAAQVMTDFRFTKEELLRLATDLDHHPDNVAPALLGGIIISGLNGSAVVTHKILPPKELKAYALIPEYEISTESARNSLPDSYLRKDAVFNLSRISFLIAGLLEGDTSLLKLGLEDQLHQPYRLPLIKEFIPISEQAIAFGALNMIISGAGSTMLVLANNDFDENTFKIYCKNTHHNIELLDVHPTVVGAQVFHDGSELKICP